MIVAGSHALVTGASAGIGLAFARQLHSQGASVTLVARRRDRIEAECARLNQARRGSAVPLCADLTEQASMEAILKYIRENRIDILVNNAGRGSLGYFEELDIDDEIAEVSLNVLATLRLAHAVIPQMKARRTGAIISVSSIAGFQPLPFMATYAATKAFNLYHSMALREELSSYGVQVLTVCPGPTETEFLGAYTSGVRMPIAGRDSAEAVVSQALRALRYNRAFIVTGWRSRLLSLGSRLFPMIISTRISKLMLQSAVNKLKTR